MGRETAPFSSHPPPLPHQAMPASHVRQQQQASYRQRYKSHFGDRAGQGFGFGVRNLVSLPNMMLVWPFSVLPTASQGGYSQCKSTPTCLARVRWQQGQDPLPHPSPKPCPPPPPAPHCLTCPPPHEGDFAKRRWCLLIHPSGCPHPGHCRRLSSS